MTKVATALPHNIPSNRKQQIVYFYVSPLNIIAQARVGFGFQGVQWHNFIADKTGRVFVGKQHDKSMEVHILFVHAFFLPVGMDPVVAPDEIHQGPERFPSDLGVPSPGPFLLIIFTTIIIITTGPCVTLTKS